MSNNPENLYQKRPGGPWWILYYVNGRLVRRALGTTSQREAKPLRDQILGVRAGGDRIRAKFGITAASTEGAPVPAFKAVADQWLKAQESDAELAARSAKKYRGIVNKWLLPAFGSLTMEGDLGVGGVVHRRPARVARPPWEDEPRSDRQHGRPPPGHLPVRAPARVLGRS